MKVDTSREAVEALIQFINHNRQYEKLEEVDVEAYQQASDVLRALLTERDAAYAAGFEACRDEAAARLERDAEALSGYGQSLIRSRTFRQCVEKVRALKPQNKDATND